MDNKEFIEYIKDKINHQEKVLETYHYNSESDESYDRGKLTAYEGILDDFWLMDNN